MRNWNTCWEMETYQETKIDKQYTQMLWLSIMLQIALLAIWVLLGRGLLIYLSLSKTWHSCLWRAATSQTVTVKHAFSIVIVERFWIWWLTEAEILLQQATIHLHCNNDFDKIFGFHTICTVCLVCDMTEFYEYAWMLSALARFHYIFA